MIAVPQTDLPGGDVGEQRQGWQVRQEAAAEELEGKASREETKEEVSVAPAV
jgi:hypothetical protein